MEPKICACMDGELYIEIAKPEKGSQQELIITVSITRTYVIPGMLDIINQDDNEDRTESCKEANLARSFVM